MKIEPELPDHPKFILLKQRVGAMALEVLIRLWGHCETNKRGEFWRGAGADYVEAVCRWVKPRGELFAALNEIGWVLVEKDGVRVHDWAKTNWRAVSNWELGSRPKHAASPQAQALVKPRLNQGISPLTEGMTDSTEGMKQAHPGETKCDCNIPSKTECVAWARDNLVDPAWTDRKWEYTEATHGWIRNGRLIGWQKLWKAWFEEDVRSGRQRCSGLENGKNGGGESVAQQLYNLDKKLEELDGQIDAFENTNPDLAAKLSQQREQLAQQRAALVA